MIEYVALVLGLGYIGYLVHEHFATNKLRSSFRHIVHVNGIRGKSTVARLIGAALSASGIRTFTKVTGTKPVIIDGDGNEKPIKRLGPANIREQLRTMRWAKKDHAEVLVIECMAVKAEYQALTQQRLLQADMVVITNVRVDHREEFGDDLDNIAKALANTIPQAGKLFVPETQSEYFRAGAKALETEVITVKTEIGDTRVDMFSENVAVALKVAEAFDIDKDAALAAMKGYRRDIGAFSIYQTDTTIFANGFSINDSESIREAYGKVRQLVGEKPLTVIINNRTDRPLRAREHLLLLKQLAPQAVFVAGGFYALFKNKLRGIEVKRYRHIEQLQQEFVFGIGNIRKYGYEIIEYFQTKGTVFYG